MEKCNIILGLFYRFILNRFSLEFVWLFSLFCHVCFWLWSGHIQRNPFIINQKIFCVFVECTYSMDSFFVFFCDSLFGYMPQMNSERAHTHGGRERDFKMECKHKRNSPLSIYCLFRENLVPISQLLSNLALHWALYNSGSLLNVCTLYMYNAEAIVCSFVRWFVHSCYLSRIFMCNRMRELLK